MADTFDSVLKIRLPETGAYNNTWGSILNSDALTLLAQAVTGEIEVPIGSSLAFSLAALADGAASAARYFCLKITGTPAAAFTFTLPGSVLKKFYLIDNQAGQSGTIKYAAGTTVVVPNGERRLVWCDGTNVVNVYSSASDSAALGGVAAANYARLDIANVFAGRNSTPFQTVTESPTTTVNAASGNHQILTLTGNRVMAAPTNPVDGQELVLVVVQDATGGRTLSWNSVFEFEGGITPVLSTVAATKDVFWMVYNSALARWLVARFSSIAAPGGASYTLTIDENTVDWNLLEKLGTLPGAVTVNVTVATGVVCQALSVGSFAIDLSGLPAGSTVNFTNNGYALGRGGRGGKGYLSLSMMSLGYSVGEGGGAAVRGPGTGNTFNVTNGSGRIWGGGGGGGGGSANYGGAGTSAGGGGGGGAGGGIGGHSYGGDFGNPGSTGVNGALGTGGAKADSGTGVGYDGGAGGTWGAAGSNNGGNAAAGGAAGKAIELNGGAAPTFISGSGSPNVIGVVS